MLNKNATFFLSSILTPFVLWWLASVASDMVLSPVEVIENLYVNRTNHIGNALHTIGNAAWGLVIASVSVITLVILIGLCPRSEKILTPYLVFIKATPAIAFAPVFILLVGAGGNAKSLTAAVICFFPIAMGAISSMKTIPERLDILPRVYGATSWNRFKSLGWAYALRGFSDGCLTAAPLAVVGSIVGDYVIGSTRPGGIGAYLATTVANPSAISVLSGVALSATVGLVFFVCAGFFNRMINRVLKFEKI